MAQSEERQALLNKEFWLKFLLDYHVQNRDKSSMSDQEFKDYTDAVLDELIEIRNRLNKINTDEA